MKWKFRLVLCLTLLLLSIYITIAQEQEDYNTLDEISKSTFMSIPPASAFLLIDVAPNKVFQAGTCRSVKVDWTLRSYKSTPNLAIELQPLWLLYYNNGHIREYRRATNFYRALSKVSISIGTVNWGPQRTIAYAGKINLYTDHDPLLEPSLEESIETYEDYKSEHKFRIKALKNSLLKTKNMNEKRSIQRNISNEMDSLHSISIDQAYYNDEIKNQYYKENWNATAVDLGFGKINNYDIQTDSTFKINDGLGLWLIGSKDLGRKFQATGMIKLIHFDQLNTHLMVGANIRYGNPRFNFYTELVHDIWKNPSLPGSSDSKQIRQLEKTTFCYGGELKLNNIIQLNFGIRTNLDQHFKLASILPTANVMCLMPL